MNPLILICAAGASSRFEAGDKLMAQFQGAPIMAPALRATTQTGFQTWCAVPALDHPRAKLVQDFDITAKVLTGSTEGLSGTLRDAVAALPGEVNYLIIVLADMPMISADAIRHLWQARLKSVNARAWRLVGNPSGAGHPVMVHRDLFPDFASISGDDGAKSILKRHHARVMSVEWAVEWKGHSPTLDVDTLADLERLRRDNP